MTSKMIENISTSICFVEPKKKSCCEVGNRIKFENCSAAVWWLRVGWQCCDNSHARCCLATGLLATGVYIDKIYRIQKGFQQVSQHSQEIKVGLLWVAF